MAESEFSVNFLDANDPWVQKDDSKQVKRKEMDCLNHRCLWRKVKRSELP